VAVGTAFALSGLAFASWMSRSPAIRDALELGVAQFGLLLLCLSTGAVAALPLSGPLVHRVGPARAVLGGGIAVTLGLLVLAASTGSAVAPLAGLGLFVLGSGISVWDVAMNVEGANVERRLGRTLMPRFHAGFSIGTVAGALLGAGAAALGIPAVAQLTATAFLIVTLVAVATRRFQPMPKRAADVVRPRSGALRAWLEWRTLLVGLLVLAFAFTEGVANDWLTLALVDGYGASDAFGAIGFGAFVAAMTLSRMVGGSALERWGRVPVLRATALLSLAGLLLVVFGPALPWAIVGALLWGAGAALGFPVGMSAASDDPERAALRVSVVSSIGYTAFLAGPPAVGFLAEQFGLLRALLVVLAALVVGLAVVGAARPLPADPAGRSAADSDRPPPVARATGA
jgi:fucose permease